ncbi:MAG: type VI secretion system ATPase TssH, partial [Acetivibrio sp.]
ELRGYFRPEFLNRLDETILFKPLTRENISGIINLLIQDLNRRLKDHELHLELSGEAVKFVIEEAYDPIYGARPLKRYLQKHVETLTARLILEDQVSQGDTIQIQVENGKLTASVRSAL